MSAQAVRAPAADRVRFDRVESFYRQAPQATRTNLVLAAITVAVMWGPADREVLWAWIVAVVLLHVVRLVTWRGFMRDPERFARAHTWELRCAGAMLLSGLVWGLGALAMFPAGDPLLQAYWLVMVVGISAGVTTANAFIPLAHDAYVLPLLAPLIARCIQLGGLTYYAIALGMILFLAFSMRQARHQAKLLVDAFTLRHERESLIERLSEQTRIAEESNLAKSRFFAAANHDLRQPLHALSLLASALSEHRGLTDPEARATLRRILQSIDSLGTLFDELLDIARLDAGAVEVNVTVQGLDEVFERVRLAYAPIAESKGLRLRLRGLRRAVRADPALLVRTLGNLVGNALRYTSRGGVLLGARRRGKAIRIEVWDSGIGIAAEDHGRIFEEFYQVANPGRDRGKGLGLGLASVRRMAELLGTSVSLASRPGRGSVFRFELPAAQRPEAAGAAEGLAAGAAPAVNRRVLVIDDDQEVLGATRDLLRSWGCTVHVAEDLEQAMAAPRPDLVLADFRLRGGTNGLQLIERLRQQHGGRIPAALVTAEAGTETAALAQRAGVELIGKPARPVRLRAMLDSMIRTQG